MPRTKAAISTAFFAIAVNLGFLAGCSVPPRPPGAPPPEHNESRDGDDGWLFKQMRQKNTPPAAQPAAAAPNMPPAGPPSASIPPSPNGQTPPGVYSGDPRNYAAGFAPQQPPPANLPPPGAPGGVSSNGYPPPNTGYVSPASYQQMGPGAVNPAYAAPGVDPNAPPPPADTGYPPATGYPNTGMPPASSAGQYGAGAMPPGNQGMVPVGATGTAPASPDVVPAGVTGMPAPTPPGATTSAEPVPIGPGPVSPDAKKDEESSGFDISDFSPEKIWKNIKKATGYGPDEKIARTAFKEGEDLMREKKFAEAAPKFDTASWRWPDSALEEDAMFLLGECYFFADQYSKAHDAFTNLLKKHENTRYLDTVVRREFEIGRYWDQLDVKESHWATTPNFSDKTRPLFDTFGNALAAYEAVRLHDPTGPLADSAIMATANAHFRKGQWEDAAYHYDLIRKDYPKSQFQKQAHILGLQATERLYQGPLYASTPLDRSEEIAKQTLTQFRGRLGDEEKPMLEARAAIVAQHAEREWALAAFYEKKSAYGAARYYYKNIIKDYPQTPFAERARLRLQEIQNEPDNPPNHFAWMKRWFEREK